MNFGYLNSAVELQVCQFDLITCHFSANPGQVNWVVGMWVRTVNTALLRILTTFIVMGKSSRAFNSAKNIAAIRTQIVKDMGLDHLPDIRHVSMVSFLYEKAKKHLTLAFKEGGGKGNEQDGSIS